MNDIEKSLSYYRDLLGFTVKERWEEQGALRGVELVAGSVSLWLSQDDWKKGRDRVKGQGFRLYCTTAQDVDRLAARIKAQGGVLLEEPKDQPWGGRDFAVRVRRRVEAARRAADLKLDQLPRKHVRTPRAPCCSRGSTTWSAGRWTTAPRPS